MGPRRLGTTGELALNNFYSPPEARAFEVQVTLVEAQWVEVKKEGSSSTTTPSGPVAGLPTGASLSVKNVPIEELISTEDVGQHHRSVLPNPGSDLNYPAQFAPGAYQHRGQQQRFPRSQCGVVLVMGRLRPEAVSVR